MNNIKEWIGKSLLIRIKHNNHKVNLLEQQIKSLEHLCEQDNDALFRRHLLILVRNGFKVFPGEVIANDYYEDEDDKTEILYSSYSCIDKPRMSKQYNFVVRNNERILQGAYTIMLNGGNYAAATWSEGKIFESKKVGNIPDNVNMNEPLYSGCQLRECTLPEAH